MLGIFTTKVKFLFDLALGFRKHLDPEEMELLIAKIGDFKALHIANESFYEK